MRLFEKIVFQEEIEEHSKSIISNDQFAYKRGQIQLLPSSNVSITG